MTNLVFIDSNIWLYSFLKQEEEKRKTAKKLIKSIKQECIFVNTQIINEVCYNLKKNNFPEVEIKGILSSFYSDFNVSHFTGEIMLNASKLRGKYSLSFWDSLIIASALSEECTLIYSEDMQHNQTIEKKLKIINPFLPLATRTEGRI